VTETIEEVRLKKTRLLAKTGPFRDQILTVDDNVIAPRITEPTDIISFEERINVRAKQERKATAKICVCLLYVFINYTPKNELRGNLHPFCICGETLV